MLLKGISKGVDKLVIMLSYPSDEVGNHLMDIDALDEHGVNPYTDVFTEKQVYDTFGEVKHPFTSERSSTPSRAWTISPFTRRWRARAPR